MERLILFAKRPRPGRVKTRLAPALGSARACALYLAFLRDQLRFLRSVGARGRETELHLDRPGRLARSLRPWVSGVRVRVQRGAHLGQRLWHASRQALAEGARAVVIFGADAPTLPRSRVDEAFRALRRGADAVVVPAEDGGYVLVGLSRPWAALFRNVRWGSARVLEQTRRQARRAGLELAELEPWYDVDRPRDLERLRRELARQPRRAPETARALAGLDGAELDVL